MFTAEKDELVFQSVPRGRVDLLSFGGVQGLLTPTKVTNFFGLLLA
jgi:hypothetical protein